MKILTASQVRQADNYTIDNQPIKSIDLMERAAKGCFDWISENLDIENSQFHIFCGVGNNGGDGLAMARMLSEKGNKVTVYVLRFSDNESADFTINHKRLKGTSVEIKDLHTADFKIETNLNDLIVDAIFGTGIKKPISGWVKQVIQVINELPIMRISIDLPSGIFAEFNHDNDLDAVVKSDFTLTFQHPKLALLLEDSGRCCGEWDVIDIGLDADFIETLSSEFHILTEDEIWFKLKEREKFQHKGDFGHALIVGGSKGKIGAAVLGAKAALRSGLGLLTVCIPECGYETIQTSVPEAMCLTSGQDFLDTAIEGSNFDVIGIGPGIGTNKSTIEFLKKIIDQRTDPMIFDADAINILASKPALIKFIPKNSILTPHPGEFERLVGKWTSDEDKLYKQINFSIENAVIVILKGAHTSVSTPNGLVFFNTTGNPGMATAGSGDVLLGMLTALVARKYNPIDASCIAVYVHGMAGDLAAMEFGMESMKSSDIIESIPAVLKNLYF